MDVGALIEEYGYLAIFLASMVEGEVVQASAGIAARAGLIDWRLGVLAGAAGCFSATQTYFWFGRLAAERILAKRPTLAPQVERVRGLLSRYGIALFVFYRFMYGLRTVTPLALGMSGVGPARFAVVDGLSWLVWFAVVSSLGFTMGEVVLEWVAWGTAYAAALPLLLVGGGLLWLTVRWWRSRPG
ncbi:MAG: membrane protein DedA with SNARE-associated domain [Myxococcota bacterium]|jgi:membrane protein DedA with SNARE-associated domain